MSWRADTLVPRSRSRGATAEAIQQFETAIRLDPADARSRTGLGEALDAAGKLEAAALEYEKAVQLDPALPEARADLGNSLARLGRVDEAETQLREAVRLRPDDSASRYDLAVVLWRKGQVASRAAATRRPSSVRIPRTNPLAGCWPTWRGFRQLALSRIRTMIAGKKVVVVMPAYNAERTLERTWREVVAFDFVDLVIVVDDASQDRTLALARQLPKVVTRSHPSNRGYGANQKTCYRLALDHGADIVVMIHPDYQYTPKLLPAMVDLVASGLYACVLGSRILGGQALEGGMPVWRYVANRGADVWSATCCSEPRCRSSTRDIELIRAICSSSCRST